MMVTFLVCIYQVELNAATLEVNTALTKVKQSQAFCMHKWNRSGTSEKKK